MTVGLMIELFVAFLLILTIGYCVTLNKRLKRLRNDEEALRATIAELITATEIAERAILGLKATAGDCDKNLAHRLMEAERLSSELQYYVSQGDGVVSRLVKISDAVRVPATATRPAASRSLAEPDYGYGKGEDRYQPMADHRADHRSDLGRGDLGRSDMGRANLAGAGLNDHGLGQDRLGQDRLGQDRLSQDRLRQERQAPMVEAVEGPRRLKDVAAATSERLMAIRQKRGVAA